MHIVQKKIIYKLKLVNGQRYSELYKGFRESDKFAYHLKHLVQNKFINYRDNKYFITRQGMLLPTYFKKDTWEDIHPKIPLFMFICKWKSKYLLRELYTHDKYRQPVYYLPDGIITFGESLENSCKKILDNKFGISGALRYRSTLHSIEYASKDKVMFDNIVLIYDVEVSKAVEKPSNFPNKRSQWFSKEQIRALPNRYPPIDLFILNNFRGHFSEIKVMKNYNICEEDI